MEINDILNLTDTEDESTIDDPKIPKLKFVYKNGESVSVPIEVSIHTLIEYSSIDTYYDTLEKSWISTNPFLDILDKAPVAKPIPVGLDETNYRKYKKGQYLFRAKPGQKWELFVVSYEMLRHLKNCDTYSYNFLLKVMTNIAKKSLIFNKKARISENRALNFHILGVILGKPISIRIFSLFPETVFFKRFGKYF